eukprot:6182786-Pleurochrysis_carterae.AAC.5
MMLWVICIYVNASVGKLARTHRDGGKVHAVNAQEPENAAVTASALTSQQSHRSRLQRDSTDVNLLRRKYMVCSKY